MTAVSRPMAFARLTLARLTLARLTLARLVPTHSALPTLPPAWAHAARVVVGVWIALYLAYFVQLDSPYWAATTVAVVANPVRGALFSKCLWRVLGTIVGATAMVALAAAFPQQPVLFMTGAAVWLGLFTFIASLLRYFRAYGAVLAGFTVCLIGFGSVEHPETIFDLALARVSAVTIGVLSATLVSLTFHRSVGEFELEARLASQIGAVARLLRGQLHGQAGTALYSEQARISVELAGMDEVIEFASIESFDILRRATSLRTGVAELFGALVGGAATMRMMQPTAGLSLDHQGGVDQAADDRAADDRAEDDRAADDQAADDQAADDGAADDQAADDQAADDQDGEHRAAAVVDAALTRCDLLSQAPDAGTRNALLSVTLTARDELAALMRDRTRGTDAMAIAHARELFDRLSRAARSIVARPDDPQPGSLRFPAYLEWRTAIRNGLRAMIALGLGSVFWIATAWPTGGSMLAMLGVICGLLATNASAAAASVDFAKGVVLAVLCAFICGFGLLTHVSGFPLLALSLLPFVAGSAYASTKPQLAPVVIPLLIFFLPLVRATNPMRFDLVAFFNIAFAYVCGSICAVFAFRIVLPPDAALNVRLLCSSIERDVERQGGSGPIPNRLQWEHLQHQKLVRLVGRMKDAGAARRDAVIEQALAAIAVGSAAIEIRTTLAAGTLAAPVRAVVERALGRLRNLRSSPETAATCSSELALVLTARDAGPTDANADADADADADVDVTASGATALGATPSAGGDFGEQLRVAGALQQIGTLIQQHQRFFRHPGAVFLDDVPC
jgi:uncharacterized membrane protein YccC